MIGNDIVCLEEIQQSPRAHNSRFVDKVLNPEEKSWFFAQKDKEVALWTLWALKESAYKIFNRATHKRLFGPKKFVCRIFGNGDIQVQTPVGNLRGMAEVHSNYLHATCWEKENPPKSFIFPIPKNTSANRSSLLKQKISQAAYDTWGITDARVLKNQGIPFLHSDEKNLQRPISISHHGRWGAFVINPI